MNMKLQENFIKLYENSFRENWNDPALTDYNTKETLTYGEMSAQIVRIHLLFEHLRIRKGDKIDLIGRNPPTRCIVYMATIP